MPTRTTIPKTTLHQDYFHQDYYSWWEELCPQFQDNSSPDKNKSQLLPTRTMIPMTTPHQDHYHQVKLLIRTNMINGNGELSWWGVVRIQLSTVEIKLSNNQAKVTSKVTIIIRNFHLKTLFQFFFILMVQENYPSLSEVSLKK